MLLKALQPLLYTKELTVTGKSLEENLSQVNFTPGDVIHSIENPIAPEGGIAVLKGNLASEGAVIKQSGVVPKMMKHSGPAKVVDSEEEVKEMLLSGKVQAGDILVIRYEGPKGGPGMRELSLPAAILIGNPTIKIFICGTDFAIIPSATLVNNKIAMTGAPTFTATRKMFADNSIIHSHSGAFSEQWKTGIF